VKPCNCIAKTDTLLAEHNLVLTCSEFRMIFVERGPCPFVPAFSTKWVDKERAPKGKKNSPPPMIASHCPFCGKRLIEKKGGAK
jgi:hypothetical protein